MPRARYLASAQRASAQPGSPGIGTAEPGGGESLPPGQTSSASFVDPVKSTLLTPEAGIPGENVSRRNYLEVQVLRIR